ncbi:MAG: hypothetical protein WDO19_22190 [Bacteroidota bacterium]
MLKNKESQSQVIEITDNGYKAPVQTKTLSKGTEANVIVNLTKTMAGTISP